MKQFLGDSTPLEVQLHNAFLKVDEDFLKVAKEKNYLSGTTGLLYVLLLLLSDSV